MTCKNCYYEKRRANKVLDPKSPCNLGRYDQNKSCYKTEVTPVVRKRSNTGASLLDFIEGE